MKERKGFWGRINRAGRLLLLLFVAFLFFFQQEVRAQDEKEIEDTQ